MTSIVTPRQNSTYPQVSFALCALRTLVRFVMMDLLSRESLTKEAYSENYNH
jgi:hypothetical protein